MKRILFVLTGILISLCAYSQYLADDLPKTWRQQVPNGFMEFTLHEDGSLTSVTCFGCYTCQGMGLCRVCMGNGRRFIPYMGWMTCGSCVGYGRCNACGGKGYNVMNSRTEYGITVSVDENGNTRITGVGDDNSYGSSSSKRYVEKIEYVPGYGYDNLVYCAKCKAKLERHIHVKVRR